MSTNLLQFLPPFPPKKHTSRYVYIYTYYIDCSHCCIQKSKRFTSAKWHLRLRQKHHIIHWSFFGTSRGYHSDRHQNQHQNYHHHQTPHYPHWFRTSSIVMPRNLQSSFWSFWLNCSGASTSPPMQWNATTSWMRKAMENYLQLPYVTSENGWFLIRNALHHGIPSFQGGTFWSDLTS